MIEADDEIVDTGPDGTGLVQISFRLDRQQRRLLKKLAADRFSTVTAMLEHGIALVLAEAAKEGWTG